MRKLSPLVFIILLLGTFILPCCASEQKAALSSTTPATSNISSTPITGEAGDFGIYLVDTGELVLSDRDIQTYRQDRHTFALTTQGIKHWNSFFPNSGRSLSDDKLNSKGFVVKLNGQEMYTGTFCSFLSSYLYPGVSIMTMPLTYGSFNEISIDYHDLSEDSSVTADPRNNPAIMSYLEKRCLLR